MYTNLDRSKRFQPAFTLVELLTVMAIIGILAGLLLTVLPVVSDAVKIRMAQVQMSEIVTSLQAYETAYSHFPVSHQVKQWAHPDFTYGGTLNTRAGQMTVGSSLGPGGPILKNDQVMAVLMNFTNYPGTSSSTINTNSQANPQKTTFLNARMTGDTASPGVGNDLVYRDPWGNPYVISLDLNSDGLCEDAFYKMPSVSTNGLNGLILQRDGNYAFHGSIMVWSAGPNRSVNRALAASLGENQDNVLSWR